MGGAFSRWVFLAVGACGVEGKGSWISAWMLIDGARNVSVSCDLLNGRDLRSQMTDAFIVIALRRK